jgi:hypothetical protein
MTSSAPVRDGAPPVDLALGPSRQLAWWIFAVHAAALGALAAIRLPDWAVAGLAAAALTSFIVHFRRHVLLRGARAVRRVAWTREGQWLLEDANGRRFEAALKGRPFVSLPLVVLNFADAARRRYTVLVLADNADGEERRKLRVRLRSE